MITAAPYRVQRVVAFWTRGKTRRRLLPAYPLSDGNRARRVVRYGFGCEFEQTRLSAGSAYRFYFAIIAEEFGFFGMCVLIFCYGWLVVRAFSIGKQSRDLGLTFNAYIASGIGIWIGIQSFFNIGVNIGALPTKGLTLPLMSYGGSSVFSC